ncbi:MAG: sensor domain-containing diguanylate cyclase [Clostridiales bacterium]|nr:sensor domain-containing diguanylate cyclase [Clostridiales bacterium]
MRDFFILLSFFLSIMLFLMHKRYIKSKQKFQREVDLNSLLIEISKEFTAYKDKYKLLKKILIDTLKIINEGEAGSILLYNKEKDYMEFVAAIGYDIDELKKIKLKKEELFLYKLNKLQAPDIIRNPRIFDKEYIDNEKFEMLEEMNALDLMATLSVPIYIDGEFYGIINIDNKNDYNAFSNKDIELIDFIVKHLEISIKNAILLDELNYALRVDKLTDVYNRRYFEEILEKEIKKAQRYNSKFSLIFIDLDDFKVINDTQGHKMGDCVLRYFANVLKANLRDTDVIARLGGDEFVLILHNADENQAHGKMGYIKNYLIENPLNDIVIDFSYGICEYEDGITIDEILTLADNRMYEDKKFRKINVF